MDNYTNLTTQDNIIGVMTYLNQQVDGMFGVFIIVAIFIIAWLTLYQSTNNARRSYVSASWITFVLSMIMKVMNLVPMKAIIFSSLMVGVGVCLLMWEYWTG